jgi:hypothetical protein
LYSIGELIEGMYRYRLDDVKSEYNNTRNGLIIARDYRKTDGKSSKQFTVYTQEQLASIENDDNLYEVIYEKDGYCYKMYYDIDLYIDKDKIDYYEGKMKDFIKKMNAEYKKLCEEYEPENIIILDASRPVGLKYKISKHIVIPFYVEKPEHLYTVFTYINTKMAPLQGNSDSVDDEIYDAIDKEVYIKTSKKTHQLRLLKQSKLGKPESILTGDYQVKDTLITQFRESTESTDGGLKENIYKIYDTAKIESKLEKMAEKRNYMIKGIQNIIAEDELQLKKGMTYNFKDMLNINLKIEKKQDEIDNMLLYKFYIENGIGIKTDCQLYLSIIPNSPDKKQSFRIWWILGSILKKMGIDYKIFEEWTIQAYKGDLNEVAKSCKAKWEQMGNTKYGMIHLINIAKLYISDIYLKKIFVQKFINQYRFTKDKWETVKQKADDAMDIQKYFKKGYSGLITDENVGGGKTNAVIRFTKENIDKDTFTIIFSNRILFATEIASRFATELGRDKVLNYDENRGKDTVDLANIKVLVISFESLIKWRYEIKKRCKKDTILISIYDEFETLHRNLSSGTMKKPYATIKYLIDLWRKSSFNIIIDAYMTKNAYDYVNKLQELTDKKTKMIYIDTDDRNKYPKTFNIIGVSKSSKERELIAKCYMNDMLKVLKENDDNKIVIFCEVYTSIQEIYSHLIKNGIKKEEILKNTGKDKDYMTPDELDENKSYFKNKDQMKGIKVWIYNSSILNGISIENVKYTKCYGIITKYSKQLLSSVGILGNDFLNAIARARLNNIWEIIIDIKENTAYTYSKWRESNTETSIDSKIAVAIANEIDDMRLKRIVEGYEDDDDDFDEDTFDKIEKLNSYLRNPSRYKMTTEAYYSGQRIIRVYDKNDNLSDSIFEVLDTQYMEWKEAEYLTGDNSTNIMMSMIIKNNNIIEELNGIFKIDVVEVLAQVKGNIVNKCVNVLIYDVKINREEIEKVNTKSTIVNNWNDRGLLAVDNIYKIVEKYYSRLVGDDMDTMIKNIIASPTIRRNIENWVAIKTKRKNNSFNPIYAIKILDILGINRLDKLPEILSVEDIESNTYYDKSKHIINDFKKSIGVKITPDALSRKTSIFMKYFNCILNDTGYYYKEKKKGKEAITGYILNKPKLEIEINGEGHNGYLSDYFEKLWDDKEKYEFINDD